MGDFPTSATHLKDDRPSLVDVPSTSGGSLASTADSKPSAKDVGRLGPLDGWRALSILLVLACHMLPLGPRAWNLNYAAGLMGMSIFFTLSGFLITKTLFRNPQVPSFLILRLTRILPLAWASTVIFLSIQHMSFYYYLSTLGFAINYDHSHITHLTAQFWSLCVEVHFYALAAALVGLFGLGSLRFLPLVAFVVTGFRISYGDPDSIVTHLRIDEILAGVTLALIWLDGLGRPGRTLERALSAIPLPIWAIAFAIACHPASGPLVYLRPYLASALVGCSLLAPGPWDRWLCSRPARYVAEISYALYLIHTGTMFGWLGSGGAVEKYSKRPLCFALSFGLAHLSTFYFERPCTAFGKRLSHRLSVRNRPEPVAERA